MRLGVFLNFVGTTMTNLTRFENTDGIEIYINHITGESFATIQGYSRMSGKNPSTISRRLKGVALEDSKNAEVLTVGGLQGVALISEDLICEWMPKDNPEMATRFMKLGVRFFMHSMAAMSEEINS